MAKPKKTATKKPVTAPLAPGDSAAPTRKGAKSSTAPKTPVAPRGLQAADLARVRLRERELFINDQIEHAKAAKADWTDADEYSHREMAVRVWDRYLAGSIMPASELSAFMRFSLHCVWAFHSDIRFDNWDPDSEPQPSLAQMEVVVPPNPTSGPPRTLYAFDASRYVAHSLGIEQPEVVKQWVAPLMNDGPAAIAATVIDLIERADISELETNTLSWLGNRVSHHLRRSMLLASLRARGWNLAKTAEGLRMGGTPHVLRAIRDLGLTEEYEKAKTAGIPRRGGRKKKNDPPSGASPAPASGDPTR